MTMLARLDLSMKRKHGAGGFGIEILYPGFALSRTDSGIGAIGRIDHARVTAGTVVRMHPHKDDEILTYLRRGKVRHRDTVGHTEDISNTRLMLMNAGHTFQHEEEVLPEGGVLEGLQIFLRPHTGDLEPQVQFHEFRTALSVNEWRLVAGPSGDAPLLVRGPAWVHDTRLSAGNGLDLPSAPVKGALRLLYVFAGRVAVGGATLTNGGSVLLDDAAVGVVAERDSDLVLFDTDPAAPVFNAGMFSGNVASA